jgi:hypothetical protein
MIAAALTTSVAMLAGDSLPAHYEKHATTFTDTFETGPIGGTFTTPRRGVPSDGITLRVPEKAVEGPVSLGIGYSTGVLRLRAGTPSGVVIVIGANRPVTFRRPLEISISFIPNPKHITLVGYAIDAIGHLRPVDVIKVDMAAGHASFLANQPVSLTWVYIDRE